MINKFKIGDVVRSKFNIPPWLTRGQKYIVIKRNASRVHSVWVVDDTGSCLDWYASDFKLVDD